MSSGTPATAAYDPGCTRCPRLAAFLRETRAASIRTTGRARCRPSATPQARILIVGLAPGHARRQPHGTALHRRSRRHPALPDPVRGGPCERSQSRVSADDALRLISARIANAVKCVPPQNKPLPAEIRPATPTCRGRCSELDRRAGVPRARARRARCGALGARPAARGAIAFAHAARAPPERGAGAPDRLLSLQPLQHPDPAAHGARCSARCVARACELAGLPVPAALARA